MFLILKDVLFDYWKSLCFNSPDENFLINNIRLFLHKCPNLSFSDCANSEDSLLYYSTPTYTVKDVCIYK